MDRRTKVLAAAGTALALAAGGVAVADASSIGTQTTPAHKTGWRRGFLRPRKLTHADLHLYLQGRDVEIRVDRGVVVSTTGGSITLRELDGGAVTIPVDSSTRVMRRGRPIRLSDL